MGQAPKTLNSSFHMQGWVKNVLVGWPDKGTDLKKAQLKLKNLFKHNKLHVVVLHIMKHEQLNLIILKKNNKKHNF